MEVSLSEKFREFYIRKACVFCKGFTRCASQDVLFLEIFTY